MIRLLLPFKIYISFAVMMMAATIFAATPLRTKSSNVPLWVKDAVWYQIFPERFRNGDTKNDPTKDDMKGSWPHDDPKEWNVSSWTGDWYKLQSWEKANGKGFYYNAQQRRYGGDLQGVIDKLAYLKKLGINAIYLNPIFESPSLHKYDATMFHHVDNNFGPDPNGDKRIWAGENPADPKTWRWTSADKLFLTLVSEAHKQGMRVIIDGVFNHVGITFWAFRDVEKNGMNSNYKDWFTVKKFDDPATPANEFDYAGWNGVRELPELRENENGLVAGPRAHIYDVVKRWMDPNGDDNPSDGIDGWRLDVAEMVAIPFWRDFRSWVRRINPDAYIVGEVWWEDWQNEKMFNAAKWLGGDVFDAVMNYRVAREVGYFFKANKNKISASEFAHRLDSLRGEYRSEVDYGLMNLMDSHDTDRLPSQIINADSRFDKNVNPNEDKDYKIRKPNADEIKTQKLMVLFQMTYLGAPTIYYGDEAGMWGADDPDERKPMLWADMKYDNEASHPLGESRPDDINEFNADLFGHYAKCATIRLKNPALRRGDFTKLLTDDSSDVLAFKRSYGNEHVVVVLNNSTVDHVVDIPLGGMLARLKWRNVFNETKFSVKNGTASVHVEGKSGIILRARK